jgi:hypothetical protein
MPQADPTQRSGAPGASCDPEAAYYQAVEEYFVARRGDPLFLSNADWLLVRKWRSAGLPLRIVLRGIRDALDGHAHSWGRRRKVGSLAYCAAEVELARERWERALSLGDEEGRDVRETLRGFAERLEGARLPGPRSAEVAAPLAEELRQRAASPPGTAGLEAWLGAREADLLEALRSDLGPDRVAAHVEEIERDLAPYRERMPARVLAQVRSDSLARRLLESHGMVRLSLFHL